MECREVCLADGVSHPLEHEAGLLLGALHRLLRLARRPLNCLLGLNSRVLDLPRRLSGDALSLEQRVESHNETNEANTQPQMLAKLAKVLLSRWDRATPNVTARSSTPTTSTRTQARCQTSNLCIGRAPSDRLLSC